MLGLDIGYQCTKFDHSSLGRSRIGSHDLTMPLSEMFCHPCSRTWYYQPANQIWSPPWRYKNGF